MSCGQHQMHEINTHNFVSLPGDTLIRDKIRFKVPMGVIGSFFVLSFVVKDVKKISDYRQQVVSGIFFNLGVFFEERFIHFTSVSIGHHRIVVDQSAEKRC